MARLLVLFTGLVLSAACAQEEAGTTRAPEPLYESPVLRSGDPQRLHAFEIALTRPHLYLVVSSEGNKSHDWANWIEPEVVMQDGTVLDLTTFSWKTAASASGQVHRGRNYRGGPLLVDGKEFASGLGTHADSMILFEVPGNATTFRAKVALDDGGAVRGTELTPASVRFLVFDREPTGFTSGSLPFNPNSTDPQLVAPEHISVPDDLELTVWATSPMLLNPTNMDTDAAGRIWVAEGVNYRKNRNRRPEGDRIVVLEDRDGDGKADSSHVFVQDPELVAPLGVSVFDNQVVVAQPPHLIVYTDVDRNRVFDPGIDKRENLLTGFNGKNHDHSLHAAVAGPDGKWYFNHGNCGARFTDKDGVEFLIGGPYKGGGGEWFVDHQEVAGEPSGDGHVWVGGFAAKMNPDGSGVRIIGHGFRNSYEHTVTSFGDVFQNDNDDPPACRTTWLMEGGFLGFFSPDGQRSWRADQRPGQNVPEAHWRQWDPGTLPPGDVYGGGSPTGICFYENGALPSKYAGLLASCDAGRKEVLGYYPVPEGSNFKLTRFPLIKSAAGDLFRPSDIMVGADGALYISDWFDSGVGGHNSVDKSCSGTIYRLAPRGFQPRIPAADPDSIEGAIALLCSPAQNVRHRGFETLREAGEKALPAVRELLGHYNGYIQARAVWLLPLLGAEGLRITRTLLDSPDAQTRLLAFRALRNAGEDPLQMVGRFYANEPSAAVRREVALSLRDAPAHRKAVYLAYLLQRCRADDRTYLEACGLGAEGAEEMVWNNVRNSARIVNALEWPDAFARITWRLHPRAAVGALTERALSDTLSREARFLAVETLAFTDDPRAATSLVKVAKDKGPVGTEAARWLVHLGKTRWKDFDVFSLLKANKLYDPENQTITEAIVPVFEGESRLPAPEQILALKGNAEKGRTTAARCVMCHRIEDQGVDYGPSLRGWIKNQGEARFLRAIIDPSAEIAHGFSGSVVRLKEGGEIHGLVLSPRDPVIIQSQGGTVQMIPARKVQTVEPLGRSLMLSADQLGLSAQDLADVMAYLKGLN